MNLILLFMVVIFAVIIIASITFKQKPKKENKIDSNFNTNVSSFEEEVKKEVMEETLNLDELFETISLKVIKSDSDFDFGLKRTEKNVNKY